MEEKNKEEKIKKRLFEVAVSAVVLQNDKVLVLKRAKNDYLLGKIKRPQMAKNAT